MRDSGCPLPWLAYALADNLYSLDTKGFFQGRDTVPFQEGSLHDAAADNQEGLSPLVEGLNVAKCPFVHFRLQKLLQPPDALCQLRLFPHLLLIAAYVM